MAPHNFEYHQYLRQVLKFDGPETNLYVATEKEFSKGQGIEFPYRSYFYALGLMHEDLCRLQVGVREFTLKKKSLTVVGSGIVRHWLKNNWKIRNTTALFKAELFEKPFYSNFLVDYDFFKPGANYVIDLKDDSYDWFSKYLKLLYDEQKNLKVASGILYSILESLNNTYKKESSEIVPTRNYVIVRTFDNLLQQEYRNHKDVGFYSDSLNISAKHLSDVLKTETGHTTKQCIEAFVLFEAKSLLKQTGMTVKEILYWLGYEDPSYFNKLFKAKVGLTPASYRAN
ncbi:helix-turn-helix transcriptional regulator [Fulvivirga sp. M361]|uniref:helix-turn-helix domain-containing protein n=1 Tax=Fulvivirga sp. M361 TaxID=2594266 RepID=UPI00117A2830|nr:AraC family transcriptional regulator [Fulvivirga sp. M361]TRX59193.1 helix-turn-helix transcriptional regulator [Fulvivirga sp. M361]